MIRSTGMRANDPMRELGKIQHWMQTVVTHPHGIAAGIDSEEARRQIDVASGQIEQVIRRSRAQTSIERLQVYGNAYYARLLECLRAEFPALLHFLGEGTFDGFAFGYLQACPPRSYTLAELGRNFPRYLAETRPERGRDGTGPDWADFPIDLAVLERTYSEVFDGPGPEGKRLVQPEELKAIPAERWPEARLLPVDSLRLLALSHPVHEYASAVRRKEPAVPPGPASTWLVVTRRDYVVRRQAVTQTEYELLRALVDGATVAEAIGHALDTTATDLDTLAADMERWFRRWAMAGYFGGVESEPSPVPPARQLG